MWFLGEYPVVDAISTVLGINRVLRRTTASNQTFQDELAVDARLVDVAIYQLEWCFEGQRQVAGILTFIFPEAILNLTDEEL